MKYRKEALLPFLLSAVILIVDQVTKALIVNKIPVNTIGATFLGGFFRIIHVRNPGIAFSMGDSMPLFLRKGLFVLLPLVILVILAGYYLKTEGLPRFQRYAIAGILGGGLGNIIDRIFRPAGVVDFLDFRFYGLFGLERWPTFNVADMTVVISGILLVLAFIFEERRKV